MTVRTTSTDSLPAPDGAARAALAATENLRFGEVVAGLGADDWSRPTDCPVWDVRALVAHVLGMMEGFSSLRIWVHQMRAAKKAAGDGPMIDGLTAVQVAERRHLGPEQLTARVTMTGPRQARARARVPAPLRRMPLKQEVGSATETWRLGYLLDVVLTRDTWMHRVDIGRATGREMVLTADHDGRIVADVVDEWARRHGRPFSLELGGPAGGRFAQGSGGEELALDAVEFCRTLSGRADGAGLLTQQVPF
ncbi:MAG TPA: maleylpyruvate isomerase family mycothiol-dependent enzyme [Acidimicrobiales bacterium]|jgi:uncharacterized protein (TIGR03083 family)|nr:maleylpyruvate isomerase family mycothiol-dependent enzyme [Acidimicrobiales bacterium]